MIGGQDWGQNLQIINTFWSVRMDEGEMCKNIAWKWQKCCGSVEEGDGDRKPVCKYVGKNYHECLPCRSLNEFKSATNNACCIVCCTQLVGPDICRQHCAVEYVNGTVVILPLDRMASVCVDNARIYSATPLSHGATVLVGSKHFFEFIDPVSLQVSC